MDNVKIESKKRLNHKDKLTQNDCKNTATKRAGRIIKNEIKSFQVKQIKIEISKN
jgi:hypothetical protein